MGRLTTHVLDTAIGRPAANLEITLCRVDGEPVTLKTVFTNSDGRVDEPLLEGEALTSGVYELRFAAGGYLAATGQGANAFYDTIPVRFQVTDASQHFHVPLLLSPFGYSTYRGS